MYKRFLISDQVSFEYEYDFLFYYDFHVVYKSFLFLNIKKLLILENAIRILLEFHRT